MKKKFTSLPALSLFTLSVLLFFACSKVENLLDDVPIYVDTDILTNSLTVTFINADLNSAERPAELEVEITGKDKEKVFSLLGQKDIAITDNTLKIGLRKLEKPTPENPIEFTVTAKAEGYLPIVRNFSLSSTEPVYTYLSMVKKSAPPAGVTLEDDNIQVNAAGLAEEKSLFTSMSGGKQENIRFTFREGTKFMAEGLHNVSGDLQVEYSHYDNRSDEAMSTFPGGLAAAGKDLDGNDIGKVRFIPGSFGSLRISGSSGNATLLSKPMDVEVGLNPEMLHPATQEPIQAGDVIEFWGKEDGDPTWRKLDEGTIAMRNGQPSVTFRTTTVPASWVTGFGMPAVNTIKAILHSNVSKTAPEVYYYVVVRNALKTLDPNSQIMFEGYLRLYDREELFINNVPASGIAIVDVYSAKFECNDKKYLDRTFFFWAPNPVRGFSQVNIFFGPNINDNNRFPITIDVFGVCSNGDTVLRGVPTLDLQFSNPDCPDYELLGRLRSGMGNTGALKPGKKYNFYFVHADLFRSIEDFPITTQDTTYRIESPVYNYTQDVFVDFDEMNNRIDFEWYNAQVPDKACDEYRQYY